MSVARIVTGSPRSRIEETGQSTCVIASASTSDAVDRYLRAYVDIYGKLGARWIVVHAGYHFGADKAMRMQAGLSSA